jgi:FkbM family methyltransferase
MEQTASIRPSGEGFNLEVPNRLEPAYVAGYEPFSRAIFASSALGCDVVVDIGAHMGFFSMVALQSNPSLEVIAVEASPDNFEILSRNLNGHILEGRAKALFGAFGSTTGDREFHLTEASDNGGLTGHPLSSTVQKVAVPGVTSDSLGIRSGARILAKVDVEGHEIEALEELF